MRNTVELCMIVRDEEAVLTRCLAAARPWVDRIIVVDTGSVDETASVARAWGCQVIHHQWRDDFADARNTGLQVVTADWVLVLDADEMLRVEDERAWQRAISVDRIVGYRLKIFNMADDVAVRSVTNSSPRLFRFYPGLRFKGRIHESVTDELGEHGGIICDLNGVDIKHFGYAQDVLTSRDKLERNRQLSMMLVQETPQDPVAWYHLANVACLQNRLGDTIDALSVLDTLLSSGLALPANFLLRWFQLRAWVADRQAQPTLAVAVLTDGVTHVGPSPELLYERGKLWAALGRDVEALADFWQCVEANGRFFGIERVGVRGFLVYTEMMAIYARAGRWDMAAECARRASQDPNCPAMEVISLQKLADTWHNR